MSTSERVFIGQRWRREATGEVVNVNAVVGGYVDAVVISDADELARALRAGRGRTGDVRTTRGEPRRIHVNALRRDWRRIPRL